MTNSIYEHNYSYSYHINNSRKIRVYAPKGNIGFDFNFHPLGSQSKSVMISTTPRSQAQKLKLYHALSLSPYYRHHHHSPTYH